MADTGRRSRPRSGIERDQFATIQPSEDAVNPPTYEKSITALLVVDPHNDFISEGGKIWPRIKAVAEANDCVPHMLQVLNAARQAKLRVFYAMHHRYRPGDYETWKYVAPVQKASWRNKSFEYGTWGGEFRSEFVPAPGEIVAQEHWCSSGFANTRWRVGQGVEYVARPRRSTPMCLRMIGAAFQALVEHGNVGTRRKRTNRELLNCGNVSVGAP